MTSKEDLSYLLGNRVTVFWNPERCSEVRLPYRNNKIAEQRIIWQQFTYTGIESPNHPIWPNSGLIIIGTLGLQCPCGEDSIGRWLPWRALSADMLETRGAIYLNNDSKHLMVFNHQMDEVSWWGKLEKLQAFEWLKQSFGV